MWDNMRSYRQRSDDMFDDYCEDELERVYKKGCEHGYRKAMEEKHYGERGFGNRSWTISEGHGYDEDYNERRGRRGRCM